MPNLCDLNVIIFSHPRVSSPPILSSPLPRISGSRGGFTYALVVNDLDDRGQTAGVGAVALDEDDAADLDQTPGW